MPSPEPLGPPLPGQCVGNPCDPATGNKYQTEADYRGGDGVPAFTRHYNSQLNKDLGFGVGWSAPITRRLEINGTVLLARHGDGGGEPFTCPSTSGACTGNADTTLILTKETSGYTLTRADGAIERYDTSGRMISESDRAGRTTTYTYNASNQLSSVTGPDGHILSFTYNGARVASLIDPSGARYAYSYDANGNLIRVGYPDGAAKLYHYEDARFPHHLTGTSYQDADATLTRRSTYNYDASGNAILTEQAGGLERFALQYDSATQTTVTDAANTAEILTFSEQRRIARGWNFSGTTNGWTVERATLTQSADRVTLTATAFDPIMTKSVVIDGRRHRYVTARIRQTAAGAWQGVLLYGTSAHGYSASYHKAIPVPAGLSVGGGWVNAVWDMHNLTAGDADWMSSTITSLRVDFSNTSGSAYEIDWISYGSTYPDKNVVAKVNQADGKGITQTFDEANNLLCKTNEEGQVTTYTYNSTNQKTSMTEGLTGDCTNTLTTSATRTTTYQYVSATLDAPTLIQSPSVAAGASQSVALTYGDTRFPTLPTGITQSGFTPAGNPVSRSVTLQYNAFGQIVVIDGPRTDVTDVTTLSYYECTTGGACGQLQSVTNAKGQATTYDTYDANGRLLQLTDPNGLRTNYTYDPRGRVTAITQTPPAGLARTTSYTYNAAGNVTAVTLPDGVSLTYTYNAAQKLTRVTDNLGNRIDYAYNLKGNRTGEFTHDPDGTLVREVQTAYDRRNRAASINRGGSITQQLHDAIGNLTRETDPNQVAAASGISTTHSYDALNRLIETVNNLSGATSYGYDAGDRLTQVQAPNSATTQYLYDDLGNLLQESSADRGTTSYAYDAAGNVLSKTDARGITVSYTYDAVNRVITIDYPGTAEDVALTYDTGATCTSGIGRLCQVSDAAGTTQYAYDAFGNTTQYQKTELGVTYTTAYTYDARDRITSITYPSGRVVSYGRDAVGRIASVQAPVNGINQTLLSGRSYRADGLFRAQTYGNGLSETRSYNTKGELTQQFLGSADTRIYAYDPNGNVTSLQSLPQVGSYAYDALDRLIQDQITSTPASSRSFTYDANGNRTSDNNGSYVYAAATNQLTQTPSATLTLDAAGNTLSDGTYTYSYNQDGHLSQVLSGGNVLATYSYNHLRQRTRKVTTAGTTVYHYDLAGNLIAETEANGALIRDYVWIEDTPPAQITAGASETLTYLHADHLGTPRVGTDPSQSVVWRWEGEAFGDTEPTGSVTVNLRFVGQYFDEETGLYYNWNRYYDPKLGRYISGDPVGLGGGLNIYAYVDSNPLLWIDPTGLEATAGTLSEGVLQRPAVPNPAKEAIKKALQGALPELLGKICFGAGLLLHVTPYDPEVAACDNNPTSCPIYAKPPGNDSSKRPPPGSLPIDQTPWSGDHRDIKAGVGASPADNVKIAPNGDVWVENPDGSWSNAGPASDYTGSGKASGRRGKDRERKR